MSKKVKTASTGKEIATCFQVSRDSHHTSARGAGRSGFISLNPFLLAALVAMSVAACDPVMGTGAGSPPDPSKYIHVDPATQTATVTLIAGYPATDFQFNYDGYGNGGLVLTVPAGWQITIQCLNRSTVPQSCAAVKDRAATAPIDPAWSTPDPRRGLDPGASASFTFTPADVGSYRIASLVAGSEASGMWLDLEVVTGGVPTLKAS